MKIFSTLFLFFLWAPCVFAQGTGTCFDKNLVQNAPTKSHLFVLIDQTTFLNNQLKEQVADQVVRHIDHGNSITIIVFSSYSQGKYTYVVGAHHLESLIDKKIRDTLPKSRLKNFDACIDSQIQAVRYKIANDLRSAFSGISSSHGRSDIFFSLKEISSVVSSSDAKNKTVLLVSDTLENSSITTFYLNNSVRLINPDLEIKNVEKSNGFGNFSGSSVYVIGAGLISEESSAKGIYRDPKIMQALKLFWGEYFKKSNAQLVEFGMPMLLNQLPAR